MKSLPEVITREAARAAESIHFFTGIECSRGHLSKRFTKNGSCRECSRINANAYNRTRIKPLQRPAPITEPVRVQRFRTFNRFV